jgi:hypothetical protein
MPDGKFLYPKTKFDYILEDLGMKHVGKYLMSI